VASVHAEQQPNQQGMDESIENAEEASPEFDFDENLDSSGESVPKCILILLIYLIILFIY
jgi:hypothetical protein